MRAAIRLFRNTIVLTWTVLESFLDYRRRRHSPACGISNQAAWMRDWCGTALARLGIDVRVNGPVPERGLIVSNHLSYLDIFAFGSAMPCVFVSKAEVRNWPIFGTLTTIAGTVYIDRSRRSDTRNANDGIRRALQQGIRVVVFPEGTSTDGSTVLPFYPSLFEPAVENGISITAAQITYTNDNGDFARHIPFIGDDVFLPHLLKLLSKPAVSATVIFAPSPCNFTDRKIAAVEMREEVLGLRRERAEKQKR